MCLHFLRKPRPEWLVGIFTAGSFLPEHSLVYSSGRIAEYRHMPVYMTHGTRDSLVAFDWGRSTAERLEELGWEVNRHPVVLQIKHKVIAAAHCLKLGV